MMMKVVVLYGHGVVVMMMEVEVLIAVIRLAMMATVMKMMVKTYEEKMNQSF